MNLTVIIEATRAQLLKLVVRVMVDVNMRSMPPKIIGRKTYLWAKGPLGLSKDLGPKRCLNT
jgi:hypothetical protein